MFLAKNDVEVDAEDDDAYELVIGIAAGEHREVADIAERLRAMPRGAT